MFQTFFDGLITNHTYPTRKVGNRPKPKFNDRPNINALKRKELHSLTRNSVKRLECFVFKEVLLRCNTFLFCVRVCIVSNETMLIWKILIFNKGIFTVMDKEIIYMSFCLHGYTQQFVPIS